MTTFSDDFNRANSTDLGAGWVEVSGDWSIVSNQLSPGSAGGTIILRAAGAMSSNDNYAQATIAATAAVSQGVWCRGNSNISQGYLLRNNGTSWDLFQVVGGSFTVIGTYTAAAAADDVMKVQAVGTTIKGFINGVQRISVTDTGVTIGTSVGIRSESSGSVKYDAFSAGDVANGATLSIATETETGQTVTGAKAATLGVASGVEAAQSLAGSKTTALTSAAAIEGAQLLSGAKTANLVAASATETTLAVLGAKTAALGAAGASETTQGLLATKTAVLGVAVEAAAAQTLDGAKATTLATVAESEATKALVGGKVATLGTASAADAAQPLGNTGSRTLDAAASVETAQQLTGTKAATLGPALETGTARPLTTGGTPDEDVDITVGTPYSPWVVGTPQAEQVEVGAPW